MTSDEIRKDPARRYCSALEITKQEHHLMFAVRMLQEIAAQLADLNAQFGYLANDNSSTALKNCFKVTR